MNALAASQASANEEKGVMRFFMRPSRAGWFSATAKGRKTTVKVADWQQMVLSPIPACGLILPMKYFAGLGVLAVGLIGCGGDAPSPENPTSTGTNTVNESPSGVDTNKTPENPNITITPTTVIPAENPNTKPKTNPAQTGNQEQAPAEVTSTPETPSEATNPTTAATGSEPNRVEGEANLTKKNGAFFSGDSPFNGTFVDHHENGVKSVEGRFKDGVQQGVWTYYHESGSRLRTGEYVGGRADGQWTIWREDGSKWSEQTYVNGQLNGPEVRWHPNGQKESETTWEGGRVIVKKEWDQSGAPKQ